jgi:hypothetical protein
MITYLTPDQASAMQAGGNAPMQIVDPTTRRVYYVIDSGLLAELERRSDLDAIREGVADMQAGQHSSPFLSPIDCPSIPSLTTALPFPNPGISALLHPESVVNV